MQSTVSKRWYDLGQIKQAAIAFGLFGSIIATGVTVGIARDGSTASPHVTSAMPVEQAAPSWREARGIDAVISSNTTTGIMRETFREGATASRLAPTWNATDTFREGNLASASSNAVPASQQNAVWRETFREGASAGSDTALSSDVLDYRERNAER